MKLSITFTDGSTKAFYGTRRECWKQAAIYGYRIATLYNDAGKLIGKWIYGLKAI